MNIVIDSREQKPYRKWRHFDNGASVIFQGLQVGDYSIEGFEDQIAIERKTLDDLLGSLSSGRDRFERELNRASAMPYFALVIECSLKDIGKSRYRSAMLPKAVFQSLMAFSVRYRLPIFFAGSRLYGQIMVESLLLKFAREQEKKDG